VKCLGLCISVYGVVALEGTLVFHSSRLPEFPYGRLSTTTPFDHRMLSRLPGRKAKNSQLTLDGNEQLAKPAFQMEELLLFYSSPWRKPTVPRYAAHSERWALSTVTLALRFSTRFANASPLGSADMMKASSGFSR
jgi:hypothetical protein